LDFSTAKDDFLVEKSDLLVEKASANESDTNVINGITKTLAV
jgi:hypothetical protein